MNWRSANRKCGAVQPKMLIAISCLAVLAGLVALLNRPGTKEAPRVEVRAAPAELSRTNLVLEEGRLRQLGSATPFTGFMLEHYPDGVLRSRSAVANGLLHGVSEGWYTNKQIQVSENFKEGVSHGLRTKWYPGGAKQSEAQIVDGKLNGTYRKWYENGALSEQAEFAANQPEGISLAWFPSGSLKARVAMKQGQATDQEFWKDGEKME
jgi:antitoxin component YwqK of YwqJK toxin-antitoxin module